MLREDTAVRVAEEEVPYVAAAPAPVPAPAPPLGLGETLSPVDLPEPPVPLLHGLKWTSTAIAWAVLVLILLNAHAFRDWAYRLPPSDASARIVMLAESWFDAVDRIGLNRPVETMHSWWQATRERRFQAEQNGPEGDIDARGQVAHRST